MKKVIGVVAIFIISLALTAHKEEDLDDTLQYPCGYRVDFRIYFKEEQPYLRVTTIFKVTGSTSTNNIRMGKTGSGTYWNKEREAVSDTRKDIIDKYKSDGYKMDYVDVQNTCNPK